MNPNPTDQWQLPELLTDDELEDIVDHVKGAENLTFEQMIGAEYVGPIVRDLAKPYRDACLVLLEAMERYRNIPIIPQTGIQYIDQMGIDYAADKAITKAKGIFQK